MLGIEGMEVWKFEIPVKDVPEVSMPVNAKILHFATQGLDTPHVWALVDPKMPTTRRRFRLLGTGHNFALQGKAEYVGTIHIHGGALVFHLFDCGEGSDV